MTLNGIIFMVVGILLLVGLTMFFIYGLEPLKRSILKSSGQPATAKIIGKQFGRWVTYSGSEYSSSVSSQQIILKLEVHPPAGVAYIAQDKFMAKAMDLMRLNEGCMIQVYIDKHNPQRVVCDPKTVTVSANSPAASRAGLAMADLVGQFSQGGAVPSTDQVLDALKAQGLNVTPPVIPANYASMVPPNIPTSYASMVPPVIPGMGQDDPKTKIEKLNEMLTAGLITQQEFDAKKKEILARM